MEKIKNYISRGDFESSFDELKKLKLIPKFNRKYRIIESKFNELKKNQQLGLINYEGYVLEVNKISWRLLNFVDEIIIYEDKELQKLIKDYRYTDYIDLDNQKALDLAIVIIEKYPALNLGYTFKALSLAFLERYAESKKLCLQQIDKSNSNSSIISILAYNLASTGSLTEALEFFRNAKKIDDENALTYLLNGLVFHNLNLLQQAVEEYSQSIKCTLEYNSSISLRALSYSFLGKHDLALQDIENAIALYPNDCFSFMIKGIVYYNKAEYYLSRNYLRMFANDKRSLLDKNSLFETLIYLAWSNYSLNDFELAFENLERAQNMSISEKNLDIVYYLGGMINMKMGEFVAAIELFEKYLSLESEYASRIEVISEIIQMKLKLGVPLNEDVEKIKNAKSNSLEDQRLKAVSISYVGEFEDAKKILHNVIKANHNLIQTYNDIGVVNLQEGNFSEAVYFFEKSLELDQSDPQMYLNLISAFDCLKDEQNLSRVLNEFELRHSGNKKHLLYKAALLMKKNKFKEALEIFSQAEYPYIEGNCEYYYVKGLCEFMNKNQSQAIEDFEYILQESDNDVLIKETRNILVAMRLPFGHSIIRSIVKTINIFS